MDYYIAEVLPKPPLTAFRRENNIGEYIIRVKEERYIMQQVMSSMSLYNGRERAEITQPVKW